MMEEDKGLRQLKIKCNMLIDKLEESERKRAELLRDGERVRREGDAPLAKFASGLESILQALASDRAFIEYRHASKNSPLYLKVEKETLEALITERAGMETAEFLRYARILNAVKSDRNGKCVYHSDSLRVYYLNRALAELTGTGREPTEEKQEGLTPAGEA